MPDQTSPVERIATVIVPDHDELGRLIACRIAELIRSRGSAGRPTVLGLATGSTPIGIYRELIRMHREEGLSFARVVTFNLDEYYPMDPGSLHSYHRFMWENFFSLIDIPPENVHLPRGDVRRELVDQECRRYEEAIRAAGGIDFQLLGIGRTGHIGFNEPGSGLDSRISLGQIGGAEDVRVTIVRDGQTLKLESIHRHGHDKVEIEGRIDGLPPTTAAGTFTIAGLNVQTDADTQIRKGDTPATFADLQIGMRVHVRGTPNANGALAKIIVIQNENVDLEFELEGPLGRFIAGKGAVALDGVSLTVNEVADRGGVTRFGINVIPHTRDATTLGDAAPGGRVNLEVDPLARYVARMHEFDSPARR